MGLTLAVLVLMGISSISVSDDPELGCYYHGSIDCYSSGDHSSFDHCSHCDSDNRSKRQAFDGAQISEERECVGCFLNQHGSLDLAMTEMYLLLQCNLEFIPIIIIRDTNKAELSLITEQDGVVTYEIVSYQQRGFNTTYTEPAGDEQVVKLVKMVNSSVGLDLLCIPYDRQPEEPEASEEPGLQPHDSDNSGDLNCEGTGVWAQHITHSDWCTINCNAIPSFCPRSMCLCWEDTTVEEQVPTVRLANSTKPGEGRVQVLHRGGWRNVCGNSWDDSDAHIACRELGYSGGVARWHEADDAMPDDIWMGDVYCHGTEMRLKDCPHAGWGYYDRVRACYQYAEVMCTHGDTTQNTTSPIISVNPTSLADASTDVPGDEAAKHAKKSNNKVFLPLMLSLLVFVLIAASVGIVAYILLRKRRTKNTTDEYTYSDPACSPRPHTAVHQQHKNPAFARSSSATGNVYSDNTTTATDNTDIVTSQSIPMYSSNSKNGTPHHTPAPNGDGYTEPRYKRDHSRYDDADDDPDEVIITDNDIYTSTSHNEKGQDEGQYDDVTHTVDQSQDRYDHINSVYIENNALYAASRS